MWGWEGAKACSIVTKSKMTTLVVGSILYFVYSLRN